MSSDSNVTRRIERPATPTTPSDPLIGEVLAGRYRIDGRLGRGGMGIVYVATHLILDTQIAIKVLTRSAMTEATSIRRFLREARTAAQLRNIHTARILDAGRTANGAPYLVQELLEGNDLGRLLEVRGAFPADEAVSYVRQACEAVSEAHALGIVHRDIKPTNLFCTQTPEGALIKVLDFGIAKWTTTDGSDLTNVGAILGTAEYMAPEQVGTAKDVDARADVWSLGVTLYELLSGRLPYEEANPLMLMRAVSMDPPRALHEVAPQVPTGVAKVVMRCLAKKPLDRFQTVAELSEALGANAARPAWSVTRILSKDVASPARVRSSRVDDATAQTLHDLNRPSTPPRIEGDDAASRSGPPITDEEPPTLHRLPRSDPPKPTRRAARMAVVLFAVVLIIAAALILHPLFQRLLSLLVERLSPGAAIR